MATGSDCRRHRHHCIKSFPGPGGNLKELAKAMKNIVRNQEDSANGLNTA